MARGQMELLGIAIVMVLAVMGFLFWLSISVQEENTVQERFLIENYPEKYITTFPDLSTHCTASFSELIMDCARNYDSSDFENSGRISCNGQLSCPYINESFAHTLEETVERMNLQHSLRLSRGNVQVIGLGNLACNTTNTYFSTVETGTQPFTGDVLLEMVVCQP